jgi:alkaline phosphatase
MENVEVGRLMAKAMGFDFASLNARLFVEAGSAFCAAGYTVAMDKTRPAEPAHVVSRAGQSARLPLSRNLLIIGDKVIELEGLVVLAEKLGKVYLPAQAIALVQAAF